MSPAGRGTFYSYFRGGGGSCLGAELAGYTSIGGVEFDPAISAACDLNFPNSPTTVADVCAVQPESLLDVAPTWFHASPSCRNASQAKADAGETDEDREAGRAVARFIRHWQPPRVTIENVWGYRTFDAFGSILQALKDTGYSFEYWHLNSADYGVSQTRRRLILIAKRGLWRIQRPEPTHRDGGDMWLPPWRGWYESIADLIPTLPESKFASWQLRRLKGVLYEDATGEVLSVLRSTIRSEDFQRWLQGVIQAIFEAQILRPCVHGKGFCIASTQEHVDRLASLSFTEGRATRTMRAVWASECTRRASQEFGLDRQLTRQLGTYLSALSYESPRQYAAVCDLWRAAEREGVLQQALSPFQEVWRSELYKDTSCCAQEEADENGGGDRGYREDAEMGCLIESVIKESEASPQRTGTVRNGSFIVDGTATDYGRTVTVPNSDEPMMTVSANGDKRKMRAFLVGDQYAQPQGTEDRQIQIAECDEPAFTVRANSNGGSVPRAFLADHANNNPLREADEPAHSITAQADGRTRAFLVGDQYAQPQGTPDRQLQMAACNEPAFTVRAGGSGGAVPRAFLIGGANTSDGKGGPGVGVSEAHEPTRRVNASNSSQWRAWLSHGRVVSMSPRALSVFQSFPRTYILPSRSSLACRVVGNAVPPLLMKCIGDTL